jgi:hypothetical protein
MKSSPVHQPLRPLPARGTRSWLRRMRLSLLLLIVLPFPTGELCAADPQTLSEPQIKAGFLFNFTRFVEWPASAFPTSTSPFLICIVGSQSVTDLLAEIAAEKAVGGRTLKIESMNSTDDLRGCQILFLGVTEERRAARILGSVKGTSVLTVSEVPGFALAGGMIGFVVQENRVKLEMNVDAAGRTGLRVSAKLIAVSRLVSPNSTTGGTSK